LSVKSNQTKERESAPNADSFSNVNKFTSVMPGSYGSSSNIGVRPHFTVNGKPAPTRNDWVPTESRLKEVPRHNPNIFHQNKKDNSELNIQKLSKLSQLASVSITDDGPLAETVKSIKEDNSQMRSAQKLTIQLLPPRLSAVLTHLDSPTPGITRSQNSRSILSGFRQNKIAPVFKNPRNPDNKLRNVANNRNNYARRISNGEYIITHPYQTQVIPKEEKTRFIPLAPPHKPNQLWWHPSQPSIVNRPPTRHPVFNNFRESQRRANYYSHHPQMTNNLKAPPSYPTDSYPSRPVQLPHFKDSKLISSFSLHQEQQQPPTIQSQDLKQKVGASEKNNPGGGVDRKQSAGLYPTKQKLDLTTLSTVLNHHPTIQTVAVNITEETIEKNLERIATLERAATHLQQPFLPSLPDNLRSEYSTSPASGVISFVENVENVTFSNFSTQSEHGSSASLDENIQSRDFNSDLDIQPISDGIDHHPTNQSQHTKDNHEEKATPAVVSSESLVGAPSSISHHSDQLRTISSTFLKTREKAGLTPNNVPTFAPPLPTRVSLQSVSGAAQHAANMSSQSYENFKSSELPTTSDTLTIWKSVSEEKNRN